jgi:hypothetical protein
MTSWALLVLLATLTLGCQAAGSTGAQYETIVVNETTTPYIVEADPMPGITRFHAIPPGATTRVDVISDVNGAAEAVTILEADCELIYDLIRVEGHGGVVTITPDGTNFVPERPLTANSTVSDAADGSASCADAAASLISQ